MAIYTAALLRRANGHLGHRALTDERAERWPLWRSGLLSRD